MDDNTSCRLLVQIHCCTSSVQGIMMSDVGATLMPSLLTVHADTCSAGSLNGRWPERSQTESCPLLMSHTTIVSFPRTARAAAASAG